MANKKKKKPVGPVRAKTESLVPPDGKRCQAEKPTGISFMTMGGHIPMKRERCIEKPKYIATENKVGADGHRGSMSLCEGCAEAMKKQMPGYAMLEEIEPKRPMELGPFQKRLFERLLSVVDAAGEIPASDIEMLAASVQIHGTDHEGGSPADHLVEKLLESLFDWRMDHV